MQFRQERNPLPTANPYQKQRAVNTISQQAHYDQTMIENNEHYVQDPHATHVPYYNKSKDTCDPDTPLYAYNY